MSEQVGLCVSCKEWTSVEDSCCGSGVWVDGGVEYPEENEDE